MDNMSNRKRTPVSDHLNEDISDVPIFGEQPSHGSRALGYGRLNATGSDPDLLTVALAWITAQKKRDAAFGSPLLTNPLWNILLDLYIAGAQNKTRCFEQLVAVSQVSSESARRWLNVLEQQGFVIRGAASSDYPAYMLSQSGTETMEEGLRGASEGDEQLGLGRLRLVQ